MAYEEPKEKWSGAVASLSLGGENSSTRTIMVGGDASLPFLSFEGGNPSKPVVAMEIMDIEPVEWPEALFTPFADVIGSPADWAAKCVKEYGADMICLRLAGTHPDSGDRSPEQAAETVKAVLNAIDVPLIIWGSDVNEKDNLVLPVCSQAARGSNCLLGSAKDDNYKTLTVSCLADGHGLIAESPLDINIAKQLNILIAEMGFPLDRVVVYPTTGGLGYGIEYAYSIQERARLAALGGDTMMSPPVICQVGQEAWRAKEAKASSDEVPDWGPAEERGPMWEAVTATTLLQAGSHILVMWHPKAVSIVKQAIDALTI